MFADWRFYKRPCCHNNILARRGAILWNNSPPLMRLEVEIPWTYPKHLPASLLKRNSVSFICYKSGPCAGYKKLHFFNFVKYWKICQILIRKVVWGIWLELRSNNRPFYISQEVISKTTPSHLFDFVKYFFHNLFQQCRSISKTRISAHTNRRHKRLPGVILGLFIFHNAQPIFTTHYSFLSSRLGKLIF